MEKSGKPTKQNISIKKISQKVLWIKKLVVSLYPNKNPINMKKSFDDLVKHIKQECKKHDVKLKIGRGKTVKMDTIRVGGYFDSDNRILTAASKSSAYKTLLAHEYCHLTQYVDKFHLWDLCGDSMTKIEKYLNGEDVPDIEKAIAISRDLELDNEKRTTALLDEYDLDVDKGLYIKQSNAYILFYNYMVHSRRWSKPGKAPYTNERIIAAMSDKFDMDYTNIHNPKIIKLYQEEDI